MFRKLSYALLALMSVAACSGKVDPDYSGEPVFTYGITPFIGETLTKSTVDGLGFENGDKVRLHIVCPFSTSYENGETSGYQTLTMSNGQWTSGGIGAYQYQSTLYVYTAIYSPMTRRFVWNNTDYSRLSNNFYADQSNVADYKKCDLLWAQSFRQTGARNVQLNFVHKIARLEIAVDDSALGKEPLSENAVLMLEGMPDIDGAEIIIGDYYASDSYGWDSNNRYNYKEKASCTKELNGCVLGIDVVDEEYVIGDKGHSRVVPINDIPQNAAYTAFHNHSDDETDKQFLLIVPPCTLVEKAVFWLRDGNRRFSVALDQKTFAEGTSYKVKIVL